jgi:hypothetical protein
MPMSKSKVTKRIKQILFLLDGYRFLCERSKRAAIAIRSAQARSRGASGWSSCRSRRKSRVTKALQRREWNSKRENRDLRRRVSR